MGIETSDTHAPIDTPETTPPGARTHAGNFRRTGRAVVQILPTSRSWPKTWSAPFHARTAGRRVRNRCSRTARSNASKDAAQNTESLIKSSLSVRANKRRCPSRGGRWERHQVEGARRFRHGSVVPERRI